MKLGTINGSTNNQYIDAKIEWASTPKNAANTSDVTAILYYRRNNTGYTTQGTGNFRLLINGEGSQETEYVSIGTEWVKVMSITKTVSHNSDGSKSVTISASGSIPDTTLSSTSCSGTVTLDTIPRATTLDYVGGSPNTFNSTFTYKYTPKNVNLYNRLEIRLASATVKTIDIGKKSATQNTGTFTFSSSELSNIYSKVTNADVIRTVFALKTYSDSEYTSQIGDEQTYSVNINIPDDVSTKPTATMSLSPVSSLASPFNGLYIKGYSKVDANFSNGEGKYGADIVSYSLTVQGKKYSSPYTSDYLSTSGSVTVTGTVKDSRGFSRSYAEPITVLSYSNPQILPPSGASSIVCARCDASGNLTSSGTYLKIKARRSYSKLTSGDTQNNYCIIRYRYRPDTTKTFSDWATILAKTTASDTVDSKLSGVVSSATTSYVVQVGVLDDMGNTAAVQFVVPTDSVTLHLAEGGKRVGIMRYAEDSDEEGIDVGAPIHGGGVDNLTLGTLLTATSASPIDLNTIKEVGNYYSPSAANSQYITNAPYTDGGFSLTVRELQSKNMIRQELFYGRTNWQRHYSSADGAWSAWLRYLMTEYPETTTADFVTDIGVHQIDADSYWRYRKWKSGAVDLNGVFKVTPVMEDTTGTAAVRYSEQIQIPLPFKVENFQFTGTPASNYFLLTNAAITTDSEGNNKIAFRLLRFTDFADMSLYVRIIAGGKYK